MPDVLGVIVAVQLDVVELTLASGLHAPNVPVALPVLVIATVPAGADAVPVAVSLTNTVQLTCWPTATDDGEQLTDVVVLRRPTVNVLLVPELAA